MKQNIQDKINKLKQKQDILKARIQLIENREKTRERKLDTRRKILVGSYFLDKFRRDDNYDELVKIMDNFLTREIDRKLFDLHNDKEEEDYAENQENSKKENTENK